MDNTTAPATTNPDTFKRSLKKIHNEATAHGWTLTEVKEFDHVTMATWTLDNSDGAYSDLDLRRFYRLPAKAEASFDPETGAYYGITITDETGAFCGREDTVQANIDMMTYPARRAAEVKATAQREVEQAERSAKRQAARTEYLANLDDYRVRKLASTAADEPTLEIEPGTYPNDMLRKVQAHAERHAAWRIANLATERHGWPKEDGSHIDIGEAVTMAATELMASGSWDYRDLEAQLMSAATEMMRDYRTR